MLQSARQHLDGTIELCRTKVWVDMFSMTSNTGQKNLFVKRLYNVCLVPVCQLCPLQ